jgi:hypothetical protein
VTTIYHNSSSQRNNPASAADLAQAILDELAKSGALQIKRPVNAGDKLHRRAGVKMHHGTAGRRRSADVAVLVRDALPQTQLSSSIN